MNFLFFTPVLGCSAIATVGKNIIEPLIAQGHQVNIVRSENQSLYHLPQQRLDVNVVDWQDSNAIFALAEISDIIVYQIGNNFPFHEGCITWLPKLPGIVILHDYFLGHCFIDWLKHTDCNAKNILLAWYGQEVAKKYFKYVNSSQFIEFSAKSAPMVEWICAKALGVVTHSDWDISRVLNACPGPVDIFALPYQKSILASPSVRKVDQEFTVLTIGHINPNKRPESIIRALAKSRILRSRSIYRLVGPIEEHFAEMLSGLAKKLKVRLSICGEVSDETLSQEIQQADVICCLRWPALEAASASAIETMLMGKAVIVVDTGFYSSLPDECVRKISVNGEIKNLKKNLEYFYNNPSEILAMGQRAEEWARKTFDATHYPQQLIDFSRRILVAKPVIQACHYFMETLEKWEAKSLKSYLDHIVEPLSIFQEK